MLKEDVVEKIMRVKEAKKAVILAHYYQEDEVQEIADFLGDSLELSRKAAGVDSKIIVFCGVHFMAETAKILNPGKKVLIPVSGAGCPLADMANPYVLDKLKEIHPDAAVVCYVNSPVSVKARSHVCCTSSNAVNVVRSLPHEKIIFVPDRNLGSYVSQQVPEKQIIPWSGFCPVHQSVSPGDVLELKNRYPAAPVLAHPECPPEVLKMADYVGSTSGIIKKAGETDSHILIIGTEKGVLRKLKEENPCKMFYLLSESLSCGDMKKINLEDVLRALEKEEYSVEVDSETARKARYSLDRMLEII